MSRPSFLESRQNEFVLANQKERSGGKSIIINLRQIEERTGDAGRANQPDHIEMSAVPLCRRTQPRGYTCEFLLNYTPATPSHTTATQYLLTITTSQTCEREILSFSYNLIGGRLAPARIEIFLVVIKSIKCRLLEQLEKPQDHVDKHLTTITTVYCIQFRSINRFSPPK